MFNFTKKIFAFSLFIILIALAFPASAVGQDQPVITIETDDYFRGYPVIYARDISGGSQISAFTGFRVSSEGTAFFNDITFHESRNLPFTGTVKVVYDRAALCGFTYPGEGEVTIIATDAEGNTSTAVAWCIVKPIDAPYYADHADNPCNERENRTSLSVEMGKAFMFDKQDFVSDRLVGELHAINIDTLPSNGKLSFFSEGKYQELRKKDLPKRVTIQEIHAGKLTYSPDKPGSCSFMLRLEDAFLNISQMQTEIEIDIIEPTPAPAEESADMDENPGEKLDEHQEEQPPEEAAEPSMPDISIDKPNGEHEYYLPHIVRVTDENGVEMVEGVPPARKGTYRLEMSYGEDKAVLITASSVSKLSSKLEVTMLKIPDSTLVSIDDDPEKLRQTVSDIEEELKSLGDIDPIVLTSPEKKKLLDTLGALLWEADAIELLNGARDAASLDLVRAEELLSMLPGLNLINYDISSELMADYTLAIANAAISNATQNDEGIVSDELLKAIEDAVIQYTLVGGGDYITPGIGDIYITYERIAQGLRVAVSNYDAYLLGLFSRIDYSGIDEGAQNVRVYFEIQEAEQSALFEDANIIEGGGVETEEPDTTENTGEGVQEAAGAGGRDEEENRYFVGAIEVKVMLQSGNADPVELSFKDGEQGFLCLPVLSAAQVYDLSTLRAYRVEESSSVELEILGANYADNYIILPMSETGRIEFYAKLNDQADAAEQSDEQSQNAEQPGDQPQDAAQSDSEPEKGTADVPSAQSDSAADTPESAQNPEKSAVPEAIEKSTAPEPMQKPETSPEPAATAEPKKEAAPSPVSEPAASSGSESGLIKEAQEINLPLDAARIPPGYIVGGLTLLIVLIRIIVGLARKPYGSE